LDYLTTHTSLSPIWWVRPGFGLPNNSYKPITNTAWVRARLIQAYHQYSVGSRPAL